MLVKRETLPVLAAAMYESVRNGAEPTERSEGGMFRQNAFDQDRPISHLTTSADWNGPVVRRLVALSLEPDQTGT